MLFGNALRQLAFSYRALFGWLRPLDYSIMMFAEPGVQLLFFGLLGHFGSQDVSFYVVGNAVRLMATSGLFGAASVIFNERATGTLSALLATPTPAAETFYARALLQGISGILTGLFTLGLGMLAFGIRFPHASVGWALLALLVTAMSLSGLGLLLANLSLVGTNPNLLINIVFYGLILVTGANVPLADLPAPLAAIGNAVSMTHGLAAVRAALAGRTSTVPGQLGWELLIGVCYAGAGIVLFRYAEWHARRAGTLDLV